MTFSPLSSFILMLFLFHGVLSFNGWFQCNFIMDSEARMK